MHLIIRQTYPLGKYQCIFRYKIHIVNKCGCMSEPEGRVHTGAFVNQTCVSNRKCIDIFRVDISV